MVIHRCGTLLHESSSDTSLGQPWKPDKCFSVRARLAAASQRIGGEIAMRRLVIISIVFLAGGAIAQTANLAADTRQPIALAKARHDNWRCLMRGHLTSLVETMQEMSAGEYEKAASEVEQHYGLRPGAVEFCHEPIFSKEASVAAAQLAPNPPEPVRAMFVGMKTASQHFADEARQAAAAGNPKAAWAALSTLAGFCTSCHAAYRLE